MEPEPVTTASAVGRRDDLAAVEIDGETVIYDPASELLHHLDPIATMIWERLDGTTPLADVARRLAERFDADPEVVTTDVMALVRQLSADGLTELGGAAQ